MADYIAIYEAFHLNIYIIKSTKTNYTYIKNYYTP